ncbi:MAG: succinylglutamate desuccinylase/aspartoacylase family protein [Polyangiaceae bacterium]|nr:succinylglutamate desuccinylase/aspartoacylase family protein [Polyangiaceae bacterium]
MVRPSTSPGTSVPFDDDARQTARNAADKHRRPALARTIADRRLGAYRGYSELLDAIERLGERGARLKQIGNSVKGEPLFCVYIGSEAPKARTSVVLAGVHPIEWIGIETCVHLLERLAGEDLGDRAVIAFPMVNPDGLMRVEENLRAGGRRFIRHNAHGVDLNRNFDAHWGERGWFQRLLPWIFAPGKAAASEPEVASIGFELSERRIDRAISLHSFGGAVLYPPAHTVWPIPDYAEHRAWAKVIARGACKNAYTALPCSWWSWGTTQSGLELDWFHVRHGAVSLLIECEGGPSFSFSRLTTPFAWFNPLELSRVSAQVASAALPFIRGDSLEHAAT